MLKPANIRMIDHRGLKAGLITLKLIIILYQTHRCWNERI